MADTETIRDPFLNKDVEISTKLTDRLRGKYAIGPHLPNGKPEFGWRQFEAPPIQHEAADLIDRITAERDGLLSEVECLNSNARVQAKLLADTGRENERTARNRDMWKGQCERQAEQLAKLRKALEDAANRADDYFRINGPPVASRQHKYIAPNTLWNVLQRLRAALTPSVPDADAGGGQ